MKLVKMKAGHYAIKYGANFVGSVWKDNGFWIASDGDMIIMASRSTRDEAAKAYIEKYTAAAKEYKVFLSYNDEETYIATFANDDDAAFFIDAKYGETGGKGVYVESTTAGEDGGFGLLIMKEVVK